MIFIAAIIYFINIAPSSVVHNNKVIYTVGTKKCVHISESRGFHTGGVQNQQNSLAGSRGCSVR